ncbi:MAG: arginine--tRNA ligase [Clostridia bacterium]
MDFKKLLSTDISKQLLENENFSQIKLTGDMLETPSESSLGDIALPCFQFAKTLRKSPQIIASELFNFLKSPDYISEIKVAGGYLNFYLNKNFFAKIICEEIFEKQDSSMFNKKEETVIVEYSSPNIAKPFHVGHLCSTLICDSLSKIYKELGYNIVRINYLGDYGTQFGKLIAAYNHWGNEKNLQENPFDELFKIYVKFHEESEKDPSLVEEGRMYFKRLEDGCEKEIALWQRFKDFSLEKFNKLYNRLGAQFDSYDGESFYSDKMDVAINTLKEKNLLTLSDGAQVVDLSEENMPPCIILKADGATIYATRDIAAAIYRKKAYDFSKMIYVVGIPQSLHFKQFFKVLNKMGYDWSNDCVHVGFAHVKFADGKMSTRTGQVILLDDVLDEAVKRSREKISETYIEANLIDKTSEIIGIGALKYAFLKAGREKDITFSWDETLDFNGNSGPYVQYSYARAKSILNKTNFLSPNKIKIDCDEEFELVKNLSLFKDTVIEAAERNEPSVITRYVYNLAKSFNRFYNTCEVIGYKNQSSRLSIVYAFSIIVKKSLYLLGIETPEKM